MAFNIGETAVAGCSFKAFASYCSTLAYQTKKLAQKAIESRTGDLLGEAQKSILIKIERSRKISRRNIKEK